MKNLTPLTRMASGTPEFWNASAPYFPAIVPFNRREITAECNPRRLLPSFFFRKNRPPPNCGCSPLATIAFPSINQGKNDVASSTDREQSFLSIVIQLLRSMKITCNYERMLLDPEYSSSCNCALSCVSMKSVLIVILTNPRNISNERLKLTVRVVSSS